VATAEVAEDPFREGAHHHRPRSGTATVQAEGI